tara:strand:+ start:301 stop:486 length:186 start_codon:yes stop_codon:yes gene_type:complete
MKKLNEFEEEIVKSGIDMYFYKAIKEAGKWEDKGLRPFNGTEFYKSKQKEILWKLKLKNYA